MRYHGAVAHMNRRRDYPLYRDALGRPGAGTPAEGHIFAKGGGGLQLTPDGNGGIHKALAGFIELADGRTVVFSQSFQLDTTDPSVDEPSTRVMGELATAVYLYLSSA